MVNYQAKLEDDWTAILRTMVTSSSKEGALRNIFNISFAKEQYGNNMKVMPIYTESLYVIMAAKDLIRNTHQYKVYGTTTSKSTEVVETFVACKSLKSRYLPI